MVAGENKGPYNEVDRFCFNQIGTGWDVMVFDRGNELVLSVEGKEYSDAKFPKGTPREVLETKAAELVNRAECEYVCNALSDFIKPKSAYDFTISVSDPIDIEEVSEFVRKEVVEIIHKVDKIYHIQCGLGVSRHG